MVTRIDRLGLAAAIFAASFAFGTNAAPAAEDVTPWNGDSRSAVRLIAGSAPARGATQLRAGVQIRLLRGWHTYWRYPGDAGVPPQFIFDRSDNVKHIEVLWPAPERLVDEGGTSIGYSAGVIFPLRITPQQAGRPVTLRLKLNYAICEKLCVPAEGRGELTLAGGRASQDAALAAAEGRVPKKQGLDEKADLSIRSVRLEQGSSKARAVVDVAGPADVDLFAEGPTPQWALPVPVAVAGAPPGIRRFTFELDGAPTGESYRGARITLTAVTPARAIEVSTRLD